LWLSFDYALFERFAQDDTMRFPALCVVSCSSFDYALFERFAQDDTMRVVCICQVEFAEFERIP
jgi:hypothetical protein